MSEHEVGENTGGAPGHPHLTVDQHLAPSSQSQVYEVNNIIEVDCNVGLRYVHQLNTLVGDAPGLIVFLRQYFSLNNLKIIQRINFTVKRIFVHI